jgi:hypothetical protein
MLLYVCILKNGYIYVFMSVCVCIGFLKKINYSGFGSYQLVIGQALHH